MHNKTSIYFPNPKSIDKTKTQIKTHICTKYGFDSLITSGNYGGHRRHLTDDGRRTTDDGQRQGYGISSPQVS